MTYGKIFHSFDRMGHALVSLWDTRKDYGGDSSLSQGPRIYKWRDMADPFEMKTSSQSLSGEEWNMFSIEKSPQPQSLPLFQWRLLNSSDITDAKQQLLLASHHCSFQTNRCSSCWMSHLNEATMACLESGPCCSLVIRHDSPGTTFL